MIDVGNEVPPAPAEHLPVAKIEAELLALLTDTVEHVLADGPAQPATELLQKIAALSAGHEVGVVDADAQPEHSHLRCVADRVADRSAFGPIEDRSVDTMEVLS